MTSMYVADAWIYCHGCKDDVDQALISNKYAHGKDVYKCAKGHENIIKIATVHNPPPPPEVRVDLPDSSDIRRIRKAVGDLNELDYHVMTAEICT